ncbi:MAG: DUF1697 domain-containing protein [Anaerolineae bacterium]|jgi:uncharacterized protein (DUF1697 family)|nr:DUF1697 domain-containing protein [Anaerolineae bacterium]
MPVYVSLLRGINVGGHKKIPMADLRDLYAALGFTEAQTLLQSGNAVFKSDLTDTADLVRRIEAGIEERFGFHSDLFVLTEAEFITAHDANPFAGDADIDPSKLTLTVLPPAKAADIIAAIQDGHSGVEVIRSVGSWLYIYYPEGMGRSKLAEHPKMRVGTTRNWNTVGKIRVLLA